MITFKPEGFRILAHDHAGKLRDDQGMTLILVQATGEALYASSRTGKDAIVARYKPNSDLLLLAWTGSYRTDVFQLSQADIDAHYR